MKYLEGPLYAILLILLFSIPTVWLWGSMVDSSTYWQEIVLEYQRMNFEVRSMTIQMKRYTEELKRMTPQ